MTAPTYASREQLQAALDIPPSARRARQLDRVLQSASRAVEGDLHRKFYPQQATRTFDWPDDSYSRPWRLWLHQHELISLDTFTSGGVEIATGDVLLRPDTGPPFDRVEMDLSTSAVLRAGTTHQRAISIAGWWGYRDDETPAGELAGSIDASTTTVDVTDSAAVGVGNLIRAGDERMIVTDRRMVDTGQVLGDALTARADVVTVPVGDGDQFAPDEVILVGPERMEIVDVAGDDLVVKRAVEGTVLAAHSAGAAIHAPRRLTVRRGAVGTTAASHADGAALHRHDPPGPIVSFALALGINTLLQERAGYARTVGSAENEREAAGRGLRSARAEAWKTYGRKARIRAV